VYFWRIEHLKRDLRSREVPARDVLGYVTALLVVYTLPSTFPAGDISLTASDYALMAVSIAITVGGLWAAYRVNGGADGHDFAGRLLAIGWVVGLRLLVIWMACASLLLPAAFIIAFATDAAPRRPSDWAIRAAAWTFMVGSGLVFYWRLIHHLRDVRRAV
jgi:hypothetical protein